MTFQRDRLSVKTDLVMGYKSQENVVSYFKQKECWCFRNVLSYMLYTFTLIYNLCGLLSQFGMSDCYGIGWGLSDRVILIIIIIFFILFRNSLHNMYTKS